MRLARTTQVNIKFEEETQHVPLGLRRGERISKVEIKYMLEAE